MRAQAIERRCEVSFGRPDRPADRVLRNLIYRLDTAAVGGYYAGKATYI